MRFSFITLYVKNMEKSLAFYQGLLGLKVQHQMAMGDSEFVFLGEDGQPTIELIASPSHQNNTYTGFSVGIAVNSLPKATALLQANGHKLLRGPISPTPQTSFSFFEGPDGEEIELIEQR
ncbi:VOC family protein [Ruminococcaceae bacterium OttesenSCG-928-A16]|nr:VOC family protein [Ruminococcaceae bacterium OttesenSCG-928-A16]